MNNWSWWYSSGSFELVDSLAVELVFFRQRSLDGRALAEAQSSLEVVKGRLVEDDGFGFEILAIIVDGHCDQLHSHRLGSFAGVGPSHLLFFFLFLSPFSRLEPFHLL